MLAIKGEVKKNEVTKEDDYYYSERYYGSFMRVLNLHATVNEKKIKVSFKDVVLEIHLPKAAKSKPKDIKINGDRGEHAVRCRGRYKNRNGDRGEHAVRCRGRDKIKTYWAQRRLKC